MKRLEHPAFGLLLKQSLRGQAVEGRFVQGMDSVRRFIADGDMVRLFDISWTPLFSSLGFPRLSAGWACRLDFLPLPCWSLTCSRTGNQAATRWFSSKSTQIESRSSPGLEPAQGRKNLVDGHGGRFCNDWIGQRALAHVERSKASHIRSGYEACRHFIQQGAPMAMFAIGAYLAVLDQITAGAIVASANIHGLTTN